MPLLHCLTSLLITLFFLSSHILFNQVLDAPDILSSLLIIDSQFIIQLINSNSRNSKKFTSSQMIHTSILPSQKPQFLLRFILGIFHLTKIKLSFFYKSLNNNIGHLQIMGQSSSSIFQISFISMKHKDIKSNHASFQCLCPCLVFSNQHGSIFNKYHRQSIFFRHQFHSNKFDSKISSIAFSQKNPSIFCKQVDSSSIWL